MADEDEKSEDFLGCEPTEAQLLGAIYGIVHQLEQKVDALSSKIDRFVEPPLPPPKGSPDPSLPEPPRIGHCPKGHNSWDLNAYPDCPVCHSETLKSTIPPLGTT